MRAAAFVEALGGLPALDALPLPFERRLVVAGRSILVRLSSARLAAGALRALEHHARAAAGDRREPELTIVVGDHDSPGNPVAPPGAGARPAPVTERIERYAYDGPEGRGLLHEGFRALFLADRAGARAALWLGEAGRIPYYLASSPLLPILSWFLVDRGLAVVHAGAVVTEAGAVLIAGRSGTGKSTVSLCALADGLELIGDDMCAIEPAARPVAHSLFCSAKVESADVGRYPGLAPALATELEPGDEKSLYLLDRHRAGSIRRSAPIAAVAVPLRDSSAPPVRLSVREAFLAMAPNTIFQLPGIGRQAAAGVKALVSTVPVYRVSTGRSIGEIAPRLRDFARLLAGSDAAAGAGR
jgi:hypothetical protein